MKFKKGQMVAKVISIMGYNTVAFKFKIIKSGSIIRISEYESSNLSCLEFDENGREINGMNCSYLLSQEDAIKLVELDHLQLDGDEEEAYLDVCLEQCIK